MNKFLAICAFALAMPMSNPAFAYIKCDKKADAKKKKKCEKKMAKTLAKKRANTTPIKPSDVGSEFAYMDGGNIFDTDDWYLGMKKTGIKDIDAINQKVYAAKGLIRLTVYAGHLNKSDKAAAQKLGGKLAPRLAKMEEELNGITEEINKFDASKLSGMDAVKGGAALIKTGVDVVATIAEVPGAVAALAPIVKGGAKSAVGNAVNQAKGAAGDAVNKAKNAAGQ